MSSEKRQVTLQRMLDMPEVCAWVADHEREVAEFQHHLRTIAPRTWQDEFVRVVLQSVEQDKKD